MARSANTFGAFETNTVYGSPDSTVVTPLKFQPPSREIQGPGQIVTPMAATAVGNFPDVTDRQGMGAIVIRRPAVLLPVEVIGKHAASFGVRHGLAVGVGHEEIQPARHALLHLDLQSVVVRVVAVASLVERLAEP